MGVSKSGSGALLTVCSAQLRIERQLNSSEVHVLPPRSTAGQLTLDQHIGVRIPGGQPNLCLTDSAGNPLSAAAALITCRIQTQFSTAGLH